MIPRLMEGGASFKGAALYYLHDKREEGEASRTTSARVAWTFTLNLPTDDPERAWRMMAHTAMSQAELKAAAGVKATGRKLTKPVMAYSLAWSPDEDPPAPHEMLEAAQASLAALGLEQHQALVVCHNDTAHPHVHVLINRVNPVNGIAHNGSKTKLKLSAWAEDYERSRGQILCVERVENNAARREGQNPDRAENVSRPQWEAANVDAGRAANVAAGHADAFGDQAALEREGQQRRFNESAAFHARRREGRNAIRDRYQSVVNAVRRPETTPRHTRLADTLLQADPALGLTALTQDRSTFSRQDLVRHVGRHTRSVEEFQAVLTRLETSPELVAVGRDEQGRQRFTTREHQALERRMYDHAQRLHAVPNTDLRPLWPKGMGLSKDQDAALHHVVVTGGLASIVGYAGTGKSTLLAAARRSWEAGGLTVQGMALSGIAADGLKNGSGIDSRTIHSRLRQWEQGINLPGRKDVIVIDEAGMIGSRQMERILHFATQGHAKVVLVGDPEQLQAIEAGGAFRSIVDRFGAASLETVRRQKVEWQQDATRELATGRTAAALDRYEAAGMVHAHRTSEDAKAGVIDRWREARVAQPKASQIILAYKRADVRDLNDRARAVLKAAGELGPDVSLKTEAGKRSFASGDRIYFLKNDAGLGVRNGTLATIVRIKGETVIVRLDGADGREFMFGIKRYAHIDHGYAATIHKSQGVTVDRAHLLAGSNLDRHAAYVAMTRHRDRLEVHWAADTFASRAKMVRTLGRAAVKDTSLDYDPDATPAEPALVDRNDRVEAFRNLLRQQRAARAQPAAEPPRQATGSAAAKLKMEAERRETRNRQRDEALVRKVDRDPEIRMIEGPRPSDPERVTILLTAEMLDFDRQTAELVYAMDERHRTEIRTEERSRRDLTADAAMNWYKAQTQPVEPDEPDLAEILRRRGPMPSPDR